MRTFFQVAAILFTLSGTHAAEQADIYSTDCWEIPGPPNEMLWIEIHNSKEAKISGVAHVSVLARKKGAPVWELSWICDHIAITTDALKRSVTRPLKTRRAYPERFYEALHRWQEAEKSGNAIICSTSVQDYLKERQ